MKALRVLLCACALAGVCGFATCGPDVREDEEGQESRGQATEDEMMQDVIRDSDR